MYLLFFIILVFFSFHYYNKPNDKSFITARRIALLFFIGIAGLRYNLGVDYFVYSESYSNGDTLLDLFRGKYSPNYEPLYDLTCMTLRTLHLDPQLFFLLFSIFSTVILFYVVDKFVEKKFFFLSLLIYFSFVYLLMEMQAVRQSLAASFLYLSFLELLQKRKLKAYLMVGVASMFHFSALFLFFIIPFLEKRLLILNQFIVIVVSLCIMLFRVRWLLGLIELIASLFSNVLFSARMLGYTTDESLMLERGVFVTFFIYLFVYFFFLFCNRKNGGYFLSLKGVIAQNLFFFFLVFTSLFWELSYISTRIGWYLLLGMVLLLPQMLDVVQSRNKVIAISFILLFCIVPFRKFVIPDTTTAPMVPYEGYIECNFFGVESTGRDRAAKYADDVGDQFRF